MSEENNDAELLAELSDKVEQGYGHWSGTFETLEWERAFGSGQQWDPVTARQRKLSGRPMPVLNRMHSYLSRIVNPLRINPLGIEVKSSDSEVQELYQGVIREIEHKSNASEAYESAYESAVSCGYGFFGVKVDYYDDESADLEPRIVKYDDASMVLLDPNSVAIDGSDADWVLDLTFIGEKEAEDVYDIDKPSTGHIASVWGSVPMREDMVPVCDYQKIVREEVERYWFEDGTFEDDLEEEYAIEAVTNHKVMVRKLECVRFVGTEVVWQETYDVPCITIIPVYGDRIYLGGEEKRKYAGINYWGKDSQRLINYYAAQEEEMASSAPKSPWLVPFQAIGKFKEIWKTANTKPHSFLPYDAKEGVPAPMQNQNAVNTGPMIQSRSKAEEELGETLGIRDPMMGQSEGNGQSGVSIRERYSQGEISTAQYLDNESKSISHAGTIIKHFHKSLAKNRTMPYRVRNEDGEVTLQQVNLGELLRTADFEIKTTAGPAYESRKNKSFDEMMQIMGMMPSEMPKVADILVSDSGSPSADRVAARLKKFLPAEIQDGSGEEDPEAIAALQQAEQAMVEVEQSRDAAYQAVETQTRYIEQLQNELQDEQEKYKTQLLTKQMDVQSRLEVEVIKQENENARTAAKLEAEGQKVEIQTSADIAQSMAKINADSEAQTQKLMAEMEKEDRQIVRDVVNVADKALDKAELNPVVEGPIDASMGIE